MRVPKGMVLYRCPTCKTEVALLASLPAPTCNNPDHPMPAKGKDRSVLMKVVYVVIKDVVKRMT